MEGVTVSVETVVLDRHEHYIQSRDGVSVVGPVRHRRGRRVMAARAEEETAVLNYSALETVSFEQPLSLQELLPLPGPQRHRMRLRDRIRVNAKDPAWHAHARRCIGTAFSLAVTSFAMLVIGKCSVMVLAW
jgi:hypothetical protein